MQKKTLSDVRTVLHDLLKTLPAIRRQCSEEVIKQHLALIAYYQRQYDRLAQNSMVGQPA